MAPHPPRKGMDGGIERSSFVSSLWTCCEGADVSLKQGKVLEIPLKSDTVVVYRNHSQEFKKGFRYHHLGVRIVSKSTHQLV